MVRNRLYAGMFQWNGKLHQGRHEPLVSMELWERVPGVLTGRHATPIHSYGYEFAFTGLMTCVDCGCAVVAEVKKGKYVYYHCTGHADKGRGGYADCRRKYVREEVLGRAKAATAKISFANVPRSNRNGRFGRQFCVDIGSLRKQMISNSTLYLAGGALLLINKAMQHAVNVGGVSRRSQPTTRPLGNIPCTAVTSRWHCQGLTSHACRGRTRILKRPLRRVEPATIVALANDNRCVSV